MTDKTIPEPRSVFAMETVGRVLHALSLDGDETRFQARALSQRVVEFVEKREPTARERLGAWIADPELGPNREWNRSEIGGQFTAYLTDRSGPSRYGETIQGEGATLDSAIEDALDKLEK